ncbi:Rdx family protein [Spirochaeta africana]|uniref:SelT/selW/selH selenoprotein domain protein n=1 Tax=Spirochaeta africana (strain ATCC 700263 / DSM 8902 / Z-7692) TaxID=889378 RepID=H9UHJ8_SPIAZ|nr:Rdx family protein [Spirochaeta africana]AFG36991.1 selT/selW/selH selenoprotein domain protein [Spirochaeta africana DSM 8902]
MSTKFDPNERKYAIEITYCVPCSMRDKALAVADAVISAHENQIDTLTLVTGSGGVFDVKVNDELIYSKAETGKVPTPQQILDSIAKLG